MGSLDIKPIRTAFERKKLMDALIQDIDALKIMLAEGMIESDIQRIGAEQEICFVDKNFQPAPVNMEVLGEINDNHFTYEHASYNAEINLDPLIFSKGCLGTMESNLNNHLKHLRKFAKKVNSDIVLTGILPTIGKEHLTLAYFTSVGRYRIINELLTQIRGEPYEFRIEGADQLIARHDSTMFEGCNTSFQAHLQVSAEEFGRFYNWSQAIAGPVMAVSTNSPLLLGKRLWRETRIALFQQSMDTRKPSYATAEKIPRVTFGDQWIEDSIIEIFKDDISRFPVLLFKETSENSLDSVQRGEIPKLHALCTHNGTVYRWNRGCYGVTNGKPHLRIECRYIPSGPTIVDEIANTAFWLGLMNGQPEEYYDLPDIMLFDDAKYNFIKAARMGLGAQFNWIEHRRIPAKELIINTLLPMATKGLERAGITPSHIKKYLGIIEERVLSEKTGSQWMLDTYKKLKEDETSPIASARLTSQMLDKQKTNKPVHTWNSVITENKWKLSKEMKVNQIMSRKLFTVQENDPIKLASNIMAWKKIRHLPVENSSGKLKGFLTASMLLERLSKVDNEVMIKEIMMDQPLTVKADDTLRHALDIMLKNEVDGLPVVQDGYLIGILTERDFMRITKEWLKNDKNEHYGNSYRKHVNQKKIRSKEGSG